MRCYIRKVESLAMWEAGKECKNIPSHQHAMRYALDIKEGRGAPSFWLAENQQCLEKIVLGMLLAKKVRKPENIRVLRFEEDCFNFEGLSLINEVDPKFPIPTMQQLHYVLRPANDKTIYTIVMKLLECNGSFKEFHKSRTIGNLPNIVELARKYLGEVGEEYREIALRLVQ